MPRTHLYAKIGDMREKAERNEVIYKLIEKGVPYSKISEVFGFKSKGTINKIRRREKMKNTQLSTGGALTGTQ